MAAQIKNGRFLKKIGRPKKDLKEKRYLKSGRHNFSGAVYQKALVEAQLRGENIKAKGT